MSLSAAHSRSDSSLTKLYTFLLVAFRRRRDWKRRTDRKASRAAEAAPPNVPPSLSLSPCHLQLSLLLLALRLLSLSVLDVAPSLGRSSREGCVSTR